MQEAKNIWEFYQTIVNLIQQDFTSANKFVEQAATCMLFGKEFGGSNVNSVESYEILFL